MLGRHRAFLAFLGVVSAFIMAIGGFFIVMGIHELRLARASVEWPTVPGEILESRVTVSSHRTGGAGSSGRTTSYGASVRYRYRVGGTDHEGTRVDYRTDSSGREAAEAIVARYPAGRAVRVSVDPEDPERAVLEPGGGWLDWLPIAMGAFAIVAPIVIWRFALRLIRRFERLMQAARVDSRPADA